MTRLTLWRLAAVAALGLLAGCAGASARLQHAAGQIQQTVTAISPQLAAACAQAVQLGATAAAIGAATPAGPIVASVDGYINAGCTTTAGLAKLAADPRSLAWVDGLVAQINSLKLALPRTAGRAVAG